MRAFDPKQPWQKQLKPLKNEVEAVRQASGNSENAFIYYIFNVVQLIFNNFVQNKMNWLRLS